MRPPCDRDAADEDTVMSVEEGGVEVGASAVPGLSKSSLQGRQRRCGWCGHGRTTFSGTLRNSFCQLNLFSISGCIVGFFASLEVPLQPVIFEPRAARSGRSNAPRLLDSTAHTQSVCLYVRNAHVCACMNVARVDGAFQISS